MSDAADRTIYRVVRMKIDADAEVDLEDPRWDAKSEGLYPTLADAEAAVRRLREVPAYREWPSGCRIYPVVLDQPGWPITPGRTVSRLMHFKIGKGDPGDPEDTDNAKDIGLYLSIAHAEAAVRRLIYLEGFCDWPDGFRIYSTVIDQIGWPDGFTQADADRAYLNWPSNEIVPG